MVKKRMGQSLNSGLYRNPREISSEKSKFSAADLTSPQKRLRASRHQPPQFDAPPPKPLGVKSLAGKAFSFMDINPIELARQFTIRGICLPFLPRTRAS
jgi:hypothetical protein